MFYLFPSRFQLEKRQIYLKYEINNKSVFFQKLKMLGNARVKNITKFSNYSIFVEVAPFSHGQVLYYMNRFCLYQRVSSVRIFIIIKANE